MLLPFIVIFTLFSSYMWAINVESITYTSTENRVVINIPIDEDNSWTAIDVVQSDNILNLNWNTTENSTFYECRTNNTDCTAVTNTQDFGYQREAAATYNFVYDMNSKSFNTIMYTSPSLLYSTNNDYNVSFMLVFHYSNQKPLFYKIDTKFK